MPLVWSDLLLLFEAREVEILEGKWGFFEILAAGVRQFSEEIEGVHWWTWNSPHPPRSNLRVKIDVQGSLAGRALWMKRWS